MYFWPKIKCNMRINVKNGITRFSFIRPYRKAIGAAGELQVTLLQLKQQRKLLEGEPVMAKRFIKQLRAEQRFDDEMDDLLF